MSIFKRAASLILILCFITLLSSCEWVEWRKFVSKEGRFSISIPGMPAEQLGSFSMPNMSDTRVDAHIYTVNQEKESGITYMFSYADYPKEYVAETGYELLLDGARNGALANSKGTLLYEKKITKSRLRGRELKVAIGEDMIIRGNIYLFNNRLYQTLTISKSDNKNAYRGINRFLGSFKLLRK